MQDDLTTVWPPERQPTAPYDAETGTGGRKPAPAPEPDALPVDWLCTPKGCWLLLAAFLGAAVAMVLTGNTYGVGFPLTGAAVAGWDLARAAWIARGATS